MYIKNKYILPGCHYFSHANIFPINLKEKKIDFFRLNDSAT